MTPLRIEFATHLMRAPSGATECADLWVRVTTDGFCVSAWEPTPGELEILNAGGRVELWIAGGQPPVAIVARPAKLDPL